MHQKLIKENQNQNLKKELQKILHLRRGKVIEIKRKEKNINNKLFKQYFTNYQNPSYMYKKLREAEGEINEDQVYLIKEVLNRMKKGIKNVFKNKPFEIEQKKKIINIVARILYFNRLEQLGQGLKILTPNS